MHVGLLDAPGHVKRRTKRPFRTTVYTVLELFRHRFLPIILMPRIANYWNSRYRLCGQLWYRI